MNKSLKESFLSNWLNISNSESADKMYRHTLVKEVEEYRDDSIEPLRAVIQSAHDDARLRLKKAFEISLDPLNETENNGYDPTEGYPEIFGMTTLKGYFGEVFSGLIAENFAPFGENNWRVPAFSFRYHEIAFDQLEMMMLTGESIGIIPGRTGDDCIAFVKVNNKIEKVLFCEAKCTAGHSETMIKKAHEQISGKNTIPVEIRRLIELLKDYEGGEVESWIKTLQELRFNYNSKKAERFDLITYVCGNPPKRPSNRVTWMPVDKPHNSYSGGRKLESVEIHLKDVEEILMEVYIKGTGK